VVGTAEYVVVGLLPGLSADLRVTVSSAGLLVTWYAVTVTAGGPLVTVLTLRAPRKAALLGLVAVFTVANALAALASGFAALAAARMVTALTHSTSFAIALVMAVSMVPEARRGRAIALVSAGWNLAAVLGAPLGTWIGQAYVWRTTFWAITVVSALAFAAVATLTRAPRPGTAPPSHAEIRALRDRRVMTVLTIIALCQAGLFTVYTYISPFLGEVTGFGPQVITALLAVFGACSLAGNLLGGRLADRSPWGSLCALLAALAAALAAIAVTGHSRPAAVVTLVALGVVTSALIPLLQERALAAAPLGPTLVTAAGASAFNLGIAAGSWLGGRALDAGLGLTALPWIGTLPALAALFLAVRSALRVRRRTRGGTRTEAVTAPRGCRPAHPFTRDP
jgi:DHA1 family inner membrane transport protein